MLRVRGSQHSSISKNTMLKRKQSMPRKQSKRPKVRKTYALLAIPRTFFFEHFPTHNEIFVDGMFFEELVSCAERRVRYHQKKQICLYSMMMFDGLQDQVEPWKFTSSVCLTSSHLNRII
jgi:hypothetical protein